LLHIKPPEGHPPKHAGLSFAQHSKQAPLKFPLNEADVTVVEGIWHLYLAQPYKTVAVSIVIAEQHE